jgi:transcriptional regulator with XRE-family HTH domain
MGYAGKLELQFKAKALRKKGMSIKAIEKKLCVSRSSVSLWVRDVKLTKEQFRKLYLNKRTGAIRGSYVAAMNKIRAREELVEKLKKEGEKEIGRLSKRDRFIAGVAMYFAEGSKRGGSVQFSNTDPRSVEFMVKWIKEFLGPPQKKFRGALYIHDNLDSDKAKKFWSRTTGIPLDQFTKTYIVKNNPRRLRKVKHPYGVFRITVSNVNLHRKVMGWISGLFKL